MRDLEEKEAPLKGRYRIRATLLKPGGAEIKWERWQSEKMTLMECEMLFTAKKVPGARVEFKVKITDFSCEAASFFPARN